MVCPQQPQERHPENPEQEQLHRYPRNRHGDLTDLQPHCQRAPGTEEVECADTPRPSPGGAQQQQEEQQRQKQQALVVPGRGGGHPPLDVRGSSLPAGGRRNITYNRQCAKCNGEEVTSKKRRKLCDGVPECRTWVHTSNPTQEGAFPSSTRSLKYREGAAFTTRSPARPAAANNECIRSRLLLRCLL